MHKEPRFAGGATKDGFEIIDLFNKIIVRTGRLQRRIRKDALREFWKKAARRVFGFPSPLEQEEKLLRVLNDPKNLENCYQYHACEHKLIHLLENGLDVNLENLQKAPTFNEFCVTNEPEVKLALRAQGLSETDFFREPSQDKLEETLRAAKEYDRLLSQKSEGNKIASN